MVETHNTSEKENAEKDKLTLRRHPPMDIAKVNNDRSMYIDVSYYSFTICEETPLSPLVLGCTTRPPPS